MTLPLSFIDFCLHATIIFCLSIQQVTRTDLVSTFYLAIAKKVTVQKHILIPILRPGEAANRACIPAFFILIHNWPALIVFNCTPSPSRCWWECTGDKAIYVSLGKKCASANKVDQICLDLDSKVESGHCDIISAIACLPSDYYFGFVFSEEMNKKYIERKATTWLPPSCPSYLIYLAKIRLWYEIHLHNYAQYITVSLSKLIGFNMGYPCLLYIPTGQCSIVYIGLPLKMSGRRARATRLLSEQEMYMISVLKVCTCCQLFPRHSLRFWTLKLLPVRISCCFKFSIQQFNITALLPSWTHQEAGIHNWLA